MVYSGKRRLSHNRGNMGSGWRRSGGQLDFEHGADSVQSPERGKLEESHPSSADLHVASGGVAGTVKDRCLSDGTDSGMANGAGRRSDMKAHGIWGPRRPAGKLPEKTGVFSAGLTVEASCVMAVILLSLSLMIRTAYGRCRKYTEIMGLHYAVEQLRTQEDEERRTLTHGQAAKAAGNVKGYISAETWEKKIESEVYEPEERLRKAAVFRQKP